MNKKSTTSDLKQELSFLYEVAQKVHSLEIGQLLREIVTIATKVTKADSCLIYVLEPRTNELVLRSSKNPHKDLLQKITMKLGEGITGWVAKEIKPVAIDRGANKDPRFKFFRSLPEDRFAAFLSVPITNRRGVVGVINVQHKSPHEHSTSEVNLLSAIGKLVGGAVENALLVEEAVILKEALEMRKIVEKAKGILMHNKKLSEDEAYKLLQKESMNMRKSLKEVAEAVVLAEKFLK